MQVPKHKFLSAYAAGRAIRYSIVAWLGRMYGKAVISGLQHYSKPIIWGLIGLAVLGGIAATIYFIHRKHQGLPVFRSAEKKAA